MGAVASAGSAGQVVQSPFSRLALAHALAVAGDTLIAVALAGSIFFNVSADAARPKVPLYLLVTMVPFSVVAPVIGPVLDRTKGGRRLVLTAGAAGRALLCLSWRVTSTPSSSPGGVRCPGPVQRRAGGQERARALRRG